MRAINRTVVTITIILVSIMAIYYFVFKSELMLNNLKSIQLASLVNFFDTNEENIVINESGKMDESTDERFWLNSGALFFIEDNYGYTLQGDLPKYSLWRLVYKISNPLDTDDGYHPQNIFRLITKNVANNVSQSFYVLIARDNLSDSPNRNKSNGVFIVSNYQDSNTLYYAGVRVDGTAIIKKKRDGVYHTLAQVQIFNDDTYDRYDNPNLLPKNIWIGLKMNTKNKDSKSVEIELFLDQENRGNWVKVLDVLDYGQKNSSPILNEGYGGIRSDFMDIKILNYSYESLL